MLGVITACSDSSNSQQSPQTAQEDGNQESSPTMDFKAPLTGLPSSVAIEQRPVMVMVENSPKARPQSGLTQADMVYEILAEGDITRFVAVYQSDESATAIGPVRSIRPYFAELGAGLDALIVHAGWSQDAMNVIAEKKLDHFDQVYGDAKYYWRDNSRKMPHNLYTTVEKIRGGASERGMRSSWNDPGLLFLNDPQQLSELTPVPFQKVKINYYNGYHVSYAVTSDGVMERSMLGVPHVDRTTKQTIQTNNVLICFASHKVLDKAGRRDVNIQGPGKAYLLQNGTYTELKWENKSGAIRAYKDGQEVGFLKGKTWIQVVPTDARIEWQ